MPKTAAEVIEEVFAAGELDAATTALNEQLRRLWETGAWSDTRIDEVLEAGELPA